MPRSPTPAEPPAGPVPAPRCCLPHTSRRRLPRPRLFRGAITRRLRSRGRPRTTQHSVPAGWPTLAGQVFHLLGRKAGFRHVTPWLPPPPSFAWRKTRTSARGQPWLRSMACRKSTAMTPCAARKIAGMRSSKDSFPPSICNMPASVRCSRKPSIRRGSENSGAFKP